MKKVFRTQSQLVMIIAFTLLIGTVVMTTLKMINMISSQQTRLETMDQKIAALEQTIITNSIDSELSTDKASSLSTMSTDVQSYVFIDEVPLDRVVFMTEEEASDYRKKYEHAKNIDSFQIVPIKAMLTYFNGTQEEGFVYSCVLHRNDE